MISSIFLQVAIERGYLTPEQAEQAFESSLQKEESPAESCLRQGSLSPIQVECIRALSQPLDFAPGFEITDVIGYGGMGIVFFANQLNLNRPVALKTLSQSRFIDQASLERFRREAIVIGQFRHPNIVGAYDFGESETHVYLAMEFIDGMDLEQWVDSRGPMAEDQAWLVAKQVCTGLMHAAKQGVIHRDLKPSNLLMVDPPEGYENLRGMPMVKIADFGLAIIPAGDEAHSRLTEMHTTLGSPPYMAPEQFDQQELDARCDIYSLGATLFHLLVGRAPYDGQSSAQIIAAKLRHVELDFDKLLSHISPKGRDLIRRMMSPDLKQRPAEYASLLNEINEQIPADPNATQKIVVGANPKSATLQRTSTSAVRTENSRATVQLARGTVVSPKTNRDAAKNAVSDFADGRKLSLGLVAAIVLGAALGVGAIGIVIFSVCYQDFGFTNPFVNSNQEEGEVSSTDGGESAEETGEDDSEEEDRVGDLPPDRLGPPFDPGFDPRFLPPEDPLGEGPAGRRGFRRGPPRGQVPR